MTGFLRRVSETVRLDAACVLDKLADRLHCWADDVETIANRVDPGVDHEGRLDPWARVRLVVPSTHEAEDHNAVMTDETMAGLLADRFLPGIDELRRLRS